MTYCIGIHTHDGIIGLADTRITSGTDTTVAKKLFTVTRKNHCMFIMTSGLRSVRDKAIIYFREVIEEQDHSFSKLYKAVNKFGEQVKRVADEDKKFLQESGMDFNLQAIVGGQLEDDPEPKVFLLYPQGNWFEIGQNTPYVIIGNSGFGTPVLKRSLNYDCSLQFALKAAFLSFDATRISANDVDYPIDTVVLRKNEFDLIENRIEAEELNHISEYWNSKLKTAIDEMPADAIVDKAFQRLATKVSMP